MRSNLIHATTAATAVLALTVSAFAQAVASAAAPSDNPTKEES